MDDSDVNEDCMDSDQFITSDQEIDSNNLSDLDRESNVQGLDMDYFRPNSDMDSNYRPDSDIDSIRPDSEMDYTQPDSVEENRVDSDMDSNILDLDMDFNLSDLDIDLDQFRKETEKNLISKENEIANSIRAAINAEAKATLDMRTGYLDEIYGAEDVLDKHHNDYGSNEETFKPLYQRNAIIIMEKTLDGRAQYCLEERIDALCKDIYDFNKQMKDVTPPFIESLEQRYFLVKYFYDMHKRITGVTEKSLQLLIDLKRKKESLKAYVSEAIEQTNTLKIEFETWNNNMQDNIVVYTEEAESLTSENNELANCNINNYSNIIIEKKELDVLLHQVEMLQVTLDMDELKLKIQDEKFTEEIKPHEQVLQIEVAKYVQINEDYEILAANVEELENYKINILNELKSKKDIIEGLTDELLHTNMVLEECNRIIIQISEENDVLSPVLAKLESCGEKLRTLEIELKLNIVNYEISSHQLGIHLLDIHQTKKINKKKLKLSKNLKLDLEEFLEDLQRKNRKITNMRTIINEMQALLQIKRSIKRENDKIVTDKMRIIEFLEGYLDQMKTFYIDEDEVIQLNANIEKLKSDKIKFRSRNNNLAAKVYEIKLNIRKNNRDISENKEKEKAAMCRLKAMEEVLAKKQVHLRHKNIILELIIQSAKDAVNKYKTAMAYDKQLFEKKEKILAENNMCKMKISELLPRKQDITRQISVIENTFTKYKKDRDELLEQRNDELEQEIINYKNENASLLEKRSKIDKLINATLQKLREITDKGESKKKRLQDKISFLEKKIRLKDREIKDLRDRSIIYEAPPLVPNTPTKSSAKVPSEMPLTRGILKTPTTPIQNRAYTEIDGDTSDTDVSVTDFVIDRGEIQRRLESLRRGEKLDNSPMIVAKSPARKLKKRQFIPTSPGRTSDGRKKILKIDKNQSASVSSTVMKDANDSFVFSD